MKKKWRVKTDESNETNVESPSSQTSLTDTLLANRGIESEEEKAAFLSPDFEAGIHDPFLFRQMPQAVERIFRAIENGEHITVHGDYDADGVTGSAVLITTLRAITAHCTLSTNVDSYIPHRDKEGYGLNPDSVRTLCDRGTKLLVTVDCGIANVAEIALAKTLSMDTIVVDHHQFCEELPDAILIHPRLPGETYPFPHLAAVGVAWKLACALCIEARRRGLAIPDGWEKWLLDFVSIATVTDMVPMVGENRVLEVFGLKTLNKTRRPGLKKLIEHAGYAFGDLDTESVGFGIGPRINAAGRMDHASLALELMLAESDEKAMELARNIEELNRERQRVTKMMMEEAEKMLESEQCTLPTSLIVLWSDQWSPALVGLVAGRYLDRTGKPTVAIGKHGDRWIGSGRSFSEYDITEAVKAAGEGILTRAGGHVQACGFSFDRDEDIPTFVERLHRHASGSLNAEVCVPILDIETEIQLDEITWELIETLEQFEPFGEGNKKPLFLSRNLIVVACDLIGKERNHMRLTLRAPSGKSSRFIGFKLGTRHSELCIGKPIDVVYDIGVNEWNGRKEIQCKMVDFTVV